MKTTSLLCTIITVAALLSRLSFADTPNQPAEPKHLEGRGKTVKNAFSEAARGFNNQKPAGQTPENNSALPVRPPTVISSPGARTKNAQHRGTNPAAISGAINSTGNTAAINGTGMKRKP